MENLILDVTHS